jgi:acyl-CoA thioesterase-1
MGIWISWARRVRLLTLRSTLQKLAAIYVLFTISLVPAHAADAIKILALGDSLTAGYGLVDPNDAFPAQLEKALRAKGLNVAVIQGGISGDTTTDGRARLDWAMSAKPDAVIIELGANDALRALDPKLTEANLRAIVTHIHKDGTPVLIAGMIAPPNLGRDYGDRFNPLFAKIAKEHDVLLYPFFLDGVAAVPTLNQADHIHPLPAGVKVIVGKILPSVEKLVAQVEARRKAAR